MPRRGPVGVAVLVLCGAVMLLLALVLGSWSDQAFAAYALALGAIGVWALAIATGYSARRGNPIVPWFLRSLAAIAATVLVVVISWMVTDSNRR